MTEMSGVFFLLFLQVIRCLFGVTLARLSPCLDKSETYLLSFSIFIYEGFSMWKLLLDKLFLGVDLDLYIVLSVSVLFFWGVWTISLDVFYLSVLSTV